MRATVLLLTVLLMPAYRVYSQEAPALQQVKTIDLPNVEGRIDHMAFDAKSNRLFVAALGNNSVEVVDTAGGKVVHSIRGLAQPQGIGLSPESGKLFVANAKDGSCRVFDAKTYQAIGSAELKSDADNIRYDAAAKRIYVGYGDGALAVLDADKGNRIANVKLPAHPESFQLEQKGPRIFVNLPDADGVIAVIDQNSDSVTQTWTLEQAKSNFPMALDEAHHRLFVGCRKPAKLLVIDTTSGKTISSVPCAGDTDDVWYDSTKNRVYVSGGEGVVSIIERADAVHYKAAGQIRTAAGARTSFFVSDAGMLYVAVPHRGNQKAEVRVFKTQ